MHIWISIELKWLGCKVPYVLFVNRIQTTAHIHSGLLHSIHKKRRFSFRAMAPADERRIWGERTFSQMRSSGMNGLFSYLYFYSAAGEKKASMLQYVWYAIDGIQLDRAALICCAHAIMKCGNAKRMAVWFFFLLCFISFGSVWFGCHSPGVPHGRDSFSICWCCWRCCCCCYWCWLRSHCSGSAISVQKVLEYTWQRPAQIEFVFSTQNSWCQLGNYIQAYIEEELEKDGERRDAFRNALLHSRNH